MPRLLRLVDQRYRKIGTRDASSAPVILQCAVAANTENASPWPIRESLGRRYVGPLDVVYLLVELERQNLAQDLHLQVLWQQNRRQLRPSYCGDRRSGTFRAERRRRAIAWSDRFVLFLTTRATVQGRAGVDSCRDAPAFPGERGRFTRLNDEGSDRLRQMAASICRHQLALSRFQLAPTVSLLT